MNNKRNKKTTNKPQNKPQEQTTNTKPRGATLPLKLCHYVMTHIGLYLEVVFI